MQATPHTAVRQPLRGIRPAVDRLIQRIQRCGPATPQSARLFAQRIAEQTIANPFAGKDDADAAHWPIAVARTAPQSVEAMLTADGQPNLLTGGTA